MQSPSNDAIIAARIRGRAQAMRDLAAMGGAVRARAVGLHPHSAMASASGTAAGASSLGAIAAPSDPAPPAPQVPSPTYSNPHSSFQTDVFALNQTGSSARSTKQQQQQSRSSDAHLYSHGLATPLWPLSPRHSARAFSLSPRAPTRRSPSPARGQSSSNQSKRREIAAQSRQYLADKLGQRASLSPDAGDGHGAAPSAPDADGAPPLPSLPCDYSQPATRVALPHIGLDTTRRRVFDWFRSTLHIDLLALAPPLQHEERDDDGGGDEIPPPTDGSDWWQALCARFRDGVLLGQISSALSGQPVQGLLLHPKNQAGLQNNWHSALALLRVGGGLSPSARAPSRQLISSPRSAEAGSPSAIVPAGDGIIPFTLLFSAEDLAQQAPNPALLWTLLAKIYEEYRCYTAKRNWSVEPVKPDLHPDGSASRGFVGPNSLCAVPTPTGAATATAARSRAQSCSPSVRTRRRSSSAAPPAGRGTSPSLRPASASKRRPESPHPPQPSAPPSGSASARSSKRFSAPAASIRRQSSSPAISGSRRHSPAADAPAVSQLSHSPSPLCVDSYSALVELSSRVAATQLAQEQQALSRPLLFQPKSQSQSRADDLRPDQPGCFFGSASAAAAAPSQGVSPLTCMNEEDWPPLQQVSPAHEKVLRSWLADELDLYVLPSQENGQLLADPYRNGTLLCELAIKFMARFQPPTPAALGLSSSRARVEPAPFPIRRHPLVLDAVLENCIRALHAIRQALQTRQVAWARAASAEATPRPSSPSPALRPPPFSALLRSLSAHMERVVDGLVRGDRHVIWGLLAYLNSEWNLVRVDGDHDQQQTNGAISKPSSSWSPVELALLQWMQELGVGVSIGVVEDQADLDGALRAGSHTPPPPSSSSAAAMARLVPSVPLVGVHQFISLFRKGVLLCDLVLASAPPTGPGSRLPLRNVSRDPRTWTLCRYNLRKALEALGARPRLSMHLLRAETERTLAALADGDRVVTMQLIYDIYACHAGEPPHSSAKECMGRHTPATQRAWASASSTATVAGASGGAGGMSLGSSRSLSAAGLHHAAAATTAHLSAQLHGDASSGSAAAQEEKEESGEKGGADLPLPQPRHMLRVPLVRRRSDASPSHSHVPAEEASGSGAEEASATRPPPAAIPPPSKPQAVEEALLLFDWLRSVQLACVNERVLAPRDLLSPQERATLTPEHRSLVGLNEAAQPGPASAPSAFSDGQLLCALVAKLQRSSMSVAVRSPASVRGKSAASRRAVSLHNVELALGALRTHQRMPLTHLYREAAIAIVQHDAATLRALLLDIRTAFPASVRKGR